MKTFRAKLLRVEEDSNPEEAIVTFEAETLEAAQEKAEELAKKDQGMRWRSYADSELWGKKQRRVLEVVDAGTNLA
jgi:hypothetical protein